MGISFVFNITVICAQGTGEFCLIWWKLIHQGHDIFLHMPRLFKGHKGQHLKFISRMLCQKQVSRAGTSHCIPQYLCDVIICPCRWYLLLAQHSSVLIYPLPGIFILNILKKIIELTHLHYVYHGCALRPILSPVPRTIKFQTAECYSYGLPRF